VLQSKLLSVMRSLYRILVSFSVISVSNYAFVQQINLEKLCILKIGDYAIVFAIFQHSLLLYRR
jgi:hypothetical protein